jgi:hypothetical protein
MTLAIGTVLLESVSWPKSTNAASVSPGAAKALEERKKYPNLIAI